MKLTNKKGEGFVLFLSLLAGSILVGETLIAFDILGDPVERTVAVEETSAKVGTATYRP